MRVRKYLKKFSRAKKKMEEIIWCPIDIPFAPKVFFYVDEHTQPRICHHCGSNAVELSPGNTFASIGNFFDCRMCGELWFEPYICIPTPFSEEKGIFTICEDRKCPNCGGDTMTWQFPTPARRISCVIRCESCSSRVY